MLTLSSQTISVPGAKDIGDALGESGSTLYRSSISDELVANLIENVFNGCSVWIGGDGGDDGGV